MAKKKGRDLKLVLVISQLDGDSIRIGIQSDYRQEIPIEPPDDDFWAVLDLGRIWTKLERGAT
jgi:hypothetical protein